jgi:drug/metabolite transporter (DMT)-like permease
MNDARDREPGQDGVVPPGDAGPDARRRAAGIACIVASALAFGAMAILARIAYASGVDTATLLALRFTIAATLMFALARQRGAALPRGAPLAAVTALGALGYGGQAFTFFSALTLAPAGLVALLLYLHPALVALLSAAFLHERLTRAKLAALALALAGMALTVAPALGGGADAPRAQPAGIAFGVAAAAIYAIYIVVGARVGRRVAPLPLATVVIASAAVVFVAWAGLRGPAWPATAAGWTAIVAIAVLSTVLAITLFFAGLDRIGPTRASTLSTIEPLVTVLLAAVVLGETIAPVQLAGGAMILAAVVLLARAPVQQSAA